MTVLCNFTGQPQLVDIDAGQSTDLLTGDIDRGMVTSLPYGCLWLRV